LTRQAAEREAADRGGLSQPFVRGDGMEPILVVENLEKRYGVKTVVDQVSFAVATGECLGIIGPNGAGKTTLFNLLDGSVQANAGNVTLDGVDITGLPQYRRARRGIGRAFQIPRPFIGLTVFENVLAGVMHGPPERSTAPRRRALDILETVGLADKRDLVAGGLPLLDRKRLELAKAMSVGTKMLLLDEIAGGLTEHEVLELVAIVKALKRDHAVIWIEHIAHALIAAADRIMVLHFGAKLIEGNPADVMASPAVQEVYLGIAVDEPAHA
jgi:branched-chain amino acid transport system ATP-binding protein